MYGDYGICYGHKGNALTVFDLIRLRETAARLGVHSLTKDTIRAFTFRLEDSVKTPWPESLADLIDALYDDTTTCSEELRTVLAKYVAGCLGECGIDERTTIEQVIKDHDSTFLADVAECLTNAIRRLYHSDSPRASRPSRRHRAW